MSPADTARGPKVAVVAHARARRALSEDAELIFVWGGDGMVQHCVDALADTDAVLAVLPAGTANLLLGQVALGEAGESPFVQLTRGKQFEIRFDREQPYELDGAG